MTTDEKNLISVIIPVYNTEEYLEKSVMSVLNQTYPNLEIILVDDGSTDRSGKLCDALAEKDRRIIVIHKENGGQSDARNCGLDIAVGDYIGFVDSDDTVDPRMYETLILNMAEQEAQISCCGTLLCSPDGKKESLNNDLTFQKVFTVNDALIEFTNNRIITASLWDKIYHRSIFDGLRLKKKIIYEDFQIMPYCLLRADRIVYTAKPMYYYNVTNVSSIRGHRSTKLYDIVPVCAELVELYKDVCPEGLPGMENQYIDHCLTLFYISYGNPAWDGKRKELLNVLSSVDKETCSNLYWDNKIKLKLLNAAPERYVRIYRMLQDLKGIIRK